MTSNDVVPIWARPRFVATTLLIYLAVHFAVRMAMWPTLGIDDSEQALFAQQFSWSYRLQAPPLFTWMLVGLSKAIGVNIFSISLLRYALLGIVFGFAYLTARRLLRDARLSALAVYSFGAIYMFAYYSHHDFTHTTMMSAMLSVAWYVFVRLAASPKLGWYVALGAVVGLGMLGKWNFVMFAAALPLACLVLPSYRGLVLTWKIVPAALVATLIVLPTIVEAVQEGPTAADTIQAVLVGDGGAHLSRVVEGTLRLAAAVLVYPEPLLPLVLVVFALPLWRGIRSPITPPNEPPRPDLALLVWTMAISLALHLAFVLVLGATEIPERFMQPPLFLLPIVLFMLIERGQPSPRTVNIYALMLAVLVAGTLVARIVVYLLGADHCGSCRNMAPFRALAGELREAGYSGTGTILVDGFHIGGNMRVEFPEARIMDVTYPPATWPPASGDGPCLLLWQDRDPAYSSAAKASVETYLARELRASAAASHRDGVVSDLMFGSKTRQYRMAFELYDRPTGDCR